MAPFAPRGGGKELTTIHAADLLGSVKVLQVASADQAAGLVDNRYRMGEAGVRISENQRCIYFKELN